MHTDTTELPEWEQELRDGAWQILHDEPGIDKESWKQELMRQYPAEVVDTFGTNPQEAYAQMDEWWETINRKICAQSHEKECGR